MSHRRNHEASVTSYVYEIRPKILKRAFRRMLTSADPIEERLFGPGPGFEFERKWRVKMFDDLKNKMKRNRTKRGKVGLKREMLT